MNKKPTGLILSAEDFRRLNHCVECNRALNIPYDTKCEECAANNLPKCEVCQRVLRKDDYTSYTYDIKDEHRIGANGIQSSNQYVREFKYTARPEFLQYSEKMCRGCIDWELAIKDVCWYCDNDFTNTKDNFIKHGNLCAYCVPKVETRTL